MSSNYSIFGITVDRSHAMKWLFLKPGPAEQIFVRGVEVKATLHSIKKTTRIPKML